MLKRECKTCEYEVKNICHANPPVLIKQEGRFGKATWGQSSVKDNDWCKEYSRKDHKFPRLKS